MPLLSLTQHEEQHFNKKITQDPLVLPNQDQLQELILKNTPLIV